MKPNEKSMRYKECRYSECLPEYLENCEVIEDNSDPGYQGGLEVIFHDKLKNIYYYVCYYYGSCSVCDDWEARDLSGQEITKEIDDLTLKMTEEEYKIWKNRKEDSDER